MFSQPTDKRMSLTQAQNRTLDDFIREVQSLNLSPKSRSYCTEPCLIRYLKARDWDLKKSLKLLISSIEWREKTQPDSIYASDLTAQAISGKTYRRGFDKLGRPVIYMTPARENSTDYEKNLQLIVYTVERAIDSMGPNVEQMVLIVDFNHFSTQVQPPLSVCKEMINIMSNHYPERLGACYIVDSPFIFSMLWKAIKPFINSATRAKVHFVNGQDEKESVFSKIFDLTTLESRFGGTHDFEFKQDFWQLEIELDEQRRKHQIVMQTHDESGARSSQETIMLNSSSIVEADVEVPSHSQAH